MYAVYPRTQAILDIYHVPMSWLLKHDEMYVRSCILIGLAIAKWALLMAWFAFTAIRLP